jgi:hypothetical protein
MSTLDQNYISFISFFFFISSLIWQFNACVSLKNHKFHENLFNQSSDITCGWRNAYIKHE